jgi:malate dehydrogenase
LLLVGHGSESSERKLLATRIDLLDAFDDERVTVEMVPDIDCIEADIVVVASGATISPECATRRDLGIANRAVFQHIAERCASRLPEALFIVVTNPVELGVHILAEAAGRMRVIGMGAQQDSLRFARAIALDLGISRHDVRASVLGEHGNAMYPLWRSVQVLVRDGAIQDRLKTLIHRANDGLLIERVSALRAEVTRLLEQERIAQAYDLVRAASPDARIFVEPFITTHCMHSTPNASANATLQCIVAALADDGRTVHAQVRLEGETLGIRGVCGVPIALRSAGWQADPLIWLNSNEKEQVLGCARSIETYLAETMRA